MNTNLTFAVALLALASACNAEPRSTDTTARSVAYADSAPTIDGDDSDPQWRYSQWQPMSALILGEAPSAEDFSGRYKLLWRAEGLYLLAEITDDHLVDSRPDPLAAYWDDDALEVFVDADGEPGPHTRDYRAFAYHIALDNQAVDIGPEGPAVFPQHIKSSWQRKLDAPHTVIWEVAIRIATHDGDGTELTGFRTLKAEELIGFMLAYCDADDPSGRQHFVGDVEITPVDGDRNLGYRDSRVFGALHLAAPEQKK